MPDCVFCEAIAAKTAQAATVPHSVILRRFLLSLWLEVSFASGRLPSSVVAVPSCFFATRLASQLPAAS
jgi:hypothetical protein